MRGKADNAVTSNLSYGITPAYAGKSPAPSKEHHPLWDHPRLCGEKHRAFDRSDRVEGSPPPMRGKVSFLSLTIFMRGKAPPFYY